MFFFFVPGDTHHLYTGKWWYKNGTWKGALSLFNLANWKINENHLFFLFITLVNHYVYHRTKWAMFNSHVKWREGKTKANIPRGNQTWQWKIHHLVVNFPAINLHFWETSNWVGQPKLACHGFITWFIQPKWTFDKRVIDIMFAHIFKEIEVLRTKQLQEDLFGVGKGMSQAFFDGCELTPW